MEKKGLMEWFLVWGQVSPPVSQNFPLFRPKSFLIIRNWFYKSFLVSMYSPNKCSNDFTTHPFDVFTEPVSESEVHSFQCMFHGLPDSFSMAIIVKCLWVGCVCVVDVWVDVLIRIWKSIMGLHSFFKNKKPLIRNLCPSQKKLL